MVVVVVVVVVVFVVVDRLDSHNYRRVCLSLFTLLEDCPYVMTLCTIAACLSFAHIVA